MATSSEQMELAATCSVHGAYEWLPGLPHTQACRLGHEGAHQHVWPGAEDSSMLKMNHCPTMKVRATSSATPA